MEFKRVDSLEVRRNAVLRAAQSEAATWLYEVPVCVPCRTVVTRTRVIRGVGRGPMPLPSSALGGKSCRQRMNALKIAGDSLREEGVKMSWNVPGWIPGAPIKDDTPPCARCGHRADSHLNTGFCSVRGRWCRRCRCSCYTALDSAAPQAAVPGSPHYDSFTASQPAQREPGPERQEGEQPPPEHSPDESRTRGILGKAADVATDAADAAIEILANLLPLITSYSASQSRIADRRPVEYLEWTPESRIVRSVREKAKYSEVLTARFAFALVDATQPALYHAISEYYAQMIGPERGSMLSCVCGWDRLMPLLSAPHRIRAKRRKVDV